MFWFPFFLRYGNILPSSFSMVISTPESIRLVHQCRFWVRSSHIKPFPEIKQQKHLSNLVSFFVFICQFNEIHHLTVFTANLEAESLCAEHQIAETLELTAIMIFTWFFVTHVSILTFESSNIFHKISSLVYKTLRYHVYVASVNKLSPDTLSALSSSTSELLRFHDRMAASKPIS